MTSVVFEERVGLVNRLNPGAAAAPTLADLDGDGDLDLLAGEQGGRVRYYLNIGNAWAPRFSQQSGNSNPFGRIDLVGDATTTPALADMDADGDLDLVMGDAGGDLNYYENIGAAVAPTFAKRSGTSNPFNGLDVNGGAGLGYSAPAVADLDGDGDLDLAVGAKDGSIRYYENSGSATVMVFSGNPATGASGAANPFAGISVGGDAAPAFWDLDRDGDLDLVVGQNQNPGVDRHHGGFRYFENTGNALAPAFTERTIAANPLDGLSGGSFNDAFTKPALADLDGDGAPDLVFGSRRNGLEYYEGAATAETERPHAPLRYREAAVNPFSGIDVGGNSTPTFADLDGDGDLDLLIGEDFGTFHYYRNTGNAWAPRYEEQTGAAANPFDGINAAAGITAGRAAPVPADLDGDGDLDLAVGRSRGDLVYYENTGAARAARYEERTGTANLFNGIDVGATSAPALGDLDGDGDLDLAVGDGSGRLHYYENSGSAAVAAFSATPTNGFAFNGVDLGVFIKPAFADLDRDGDLDLAVSAETYRVSGGAPFYTSAVRYYENTGTATAPAFTERTGADNPFRGAGRDDLTEHAPAFADIDGDGLLELVAGDYRGELSYFRPVATRKIYTRNAAGQVVRTDFDDDNDGVSDRAALDPGGDGNLDQLEFYILDENGARTGRVTVNLPLTWREAAVNPFSGIDVGNESAPVFGDLDGDGDLDLLVGENDGNLNYYRQNAAGVFEEQTAAANPFNGVNVGGDSGPALADLDGDGDLDLVVGNNAGYLGYYRNTGSAAAAAFSATPTNGFAFNDADLGEDPKPAFGDLDGDGDLDLAVGRESHGAPGSIYYYKNTGTAQAPAFQRQTGAANPFQSIDIIEANQAPTLVDRDGDGDLDLVLGENDGILRYFENTGGKKAPAFTERTGAANPFNSVDVGEDSVPAFGELGGDGLPDLVVGRDDGAQAGRLSYYRLARSRETYALNEDGEIIRTDFDLDDDGTADRREFDANVDGSPERIEYDTDDDGTADRREFDGDASGTPERVEFDTDDDGVVNRIEIDEDEDGVNNRVEYDENDNGDIDRVEFDADDDGTADRTEFHTWSSAGFIAGTLFDDNADGTYDRHYAYARNAAGQATVTAFDEDYNGVADRTEYDADADGNLDRVDFNTDDAGAVERTERYVRNDAGDIIRIDFDYGGNGVVDQTRLDTDGDGAMDRLHLHTLDADNRRTGFIAFGLPLEYQSVPNSPLDGIDAGSRAAPAFADLDGDGDLDLAVGSSLGVIVYYRNTGDSDSPTFAIVDGDASPFHGIDVGVAAAPEFADLDGDGDLDLAVGAEDGLVNYYKNTGSATAPVFERQTGDDNPMDGAGSSNRFSVPRFADLDGDGDLDLVMGSQNHVRYYENTGSARLPAFERRLNAANPFHHARSGWNAPAPADLDGDGDLDLLLGVRETQLHYFENTGSAAAPRFEARTWSRTPPAASDQQFVPAFADLDGDQSLELVLGKYDGHLFHYRLPVITSATHVRNQDGEVIRTNFDDGAAGTTNRIEHYLRNAVGRVVETRFDHDADSTIDRYEFDANADGVPERVEYDDDDDGRIDREAFDADEDGAVDRTRTHARDANGEIIQTDFDNDADGSPDRIETYVRNAQGRLQAIGFDENANGVAKHTDYYDEDGDVYRTDFNTDDAGSAERAEYYTRNANGGVDSIRFDYGIDGAVNQARFNTDTLGDLDRLEIYGLDSLKRRTGLTVLDLPLEYEAVPDSPLASVDAGAGSAPAFADLDGDGDLDLAVGEAEGGIRYYRNTGDSAAPAFVVADGADNPFRGIDVGDAAMPAFADLDGDGDLDLAVGGRDGLVNYYKNTGAAAVPVFEAQSGVSSPTSGITTGAGSYSMPAFADLDGDGDLDLAVGENSPGRIRYYENSGGATAVFEHRTGEENPFAAVAAGAWGVPAFADLDGDGDLDLVVGAREGRLRYYENEGSATAPAFESRAWHRTPSAAAAQNFSPAFADLDGDELLEIFWGAAAGRVQHYRLPVIVRETYTLNAAGDVIQTDIDEGGNGVIDRAVFDAAGDGVLDYSETYAYGTTGGALGRLLTKQVDDAVDGALDGVFERSESYAYNGSGAVVRTDFDEGDDGVIESAEFDEAGDGTLDRSETYTYGTTGNAQGQRVKKQIDDAVAGALDGVFERSESYAYNAAGAVIQTDFDEGDDGVVERTVFADGTTERLEVYTWNVAGGLIKKEIDDGNDNAAGVYDRTETYARVGAGPATETEFDADADGVADRREFDGDGDGRPERAEIDANDDGTVDRIEFDDDDDGAMDRAETYRRNGAGDVIETDYDADADGVADRREFDGDADGNPERVEYDDDDDGATDRTTFDADDDGTVDRTEYDGDGDGRADRIEFDTDDDGTVNRVETYTRNPVSGNILLTSFDDDNDGVVDRHELDADGDGVAERIEIDADGDGRVDRTEFDENEDGTVERSERYARNVLGAVIRTDFDDDNDGAVDRSAFDDVGDGVVDRSARYTRNVLGAVIRTDVDEGNDGIIDRSAIDGNGDGAMDEYRYDNDGDGTFDWMSYDRNNDGMMDRFEFRWEQDAGGNPLPMMYALTLDEDAHQHAVSFYDGTGKSASGQGVAGAGSVMESFSFVHDRDIVSELRPAAPAPQAPAGVPVAVLPVDAGLLAGVPAIQLAGGGAGSTDLSISGAALNMLAGGDENYRLRINGDGDDVLRFDMDEFTEAENVNVDGENYRQFVGDGGGLLVDPDIALVDV